MELARSQDATKWTWEEEEGKEPSAKKNKKRKRQKGTYETHRIIMKRKNNLAEEMTWETIPSQPPPQPVTSAYSALNCRTYYSFFIDL